MLCAFTVAAGLAASSPLAPQIHAVADLGGQPRLVGAAGLTSGDAPILTLENEEALDPSSPRRRPRVRASPPAAPSTATTGALSPSSTSCAGSRRARRRRSNGSGRSALCR